MQSFSFLKRIALKLGLKMQSFAMDAAQTAIGFATASAIQAPMKTLEYELNELFPHQLLNIGEYQDLLNRGVITEKQFNDELSKMGLDSDKRKQLITLATSIPSVSDFIRFAVREVFTPNTAQAYGLFEDYPTELTKQVKLCGLSPDYAKYFWAAHWELPSYTQGVDMYHRQIIDYDELTLLLKSLDVMPYWRDKMIKLSEMNFTRVDVRRMYQLGVMNDQEVVRAYRDLGYSQDKATKMMEFTKSSTKKAAKSSTAAEIINAFEAGIYSQGEVTEKLKSLGYKQDSIDVKLKLSQYKKDHKYLTQYLTSLKKVFIDGNINETSVHAELNKLGLSSPAVAELIKAWSLEIKPKVTLPTKAELLKWLGGEVISETKCREMLGKLGYQNEWVNIYIEMNSPLKK